MTLDYLSLPARTAMKSIAERVLGDEDLIAALADDDCSPLTLDDIALATLTAKELKVGLEFGDFFDDAGVLYMSEDLLPELTGNRASFLMPAGFLVSVGDPVMFEADSVRYHGWVTSITKHPFFHIHADDGADWSVGIDCILAKEE